MSIRGAFGPPYRGVVHHLREDIEVIRIQPFGRTHKHFVIVRVEIPGKGDQKSERGALHIDLAPVDPAAKLPVRLGA